MHAPRERRRQQTPRSFRCAMYTRKNINAGRANEFNSLRRQRKAIRAFIASRKRQGWVCLPETYEDIGQSAGTLERPALKRLLADMAAGKVDCVVIHTFDRLTRSLSDQTTLFAKFRQYDVTLVTVCPMAFYVLRTGARKASRFTVPPSTYQDS
jgi:site-specific DNA recombinase